MGRDHNGLTCVIGARAGSGRVPSKNRALVGGTPLYRNALQAACESRVCDLVVLTTDDRQILTEAADEPGVTLDERPPSLAGPDPSMFDVLHELAARRPELFFEDGHLMLLTPCHPFRTARHVREAWEQYRAGGAEALVSVTRYPFPPELRLRMEGGRVRREWQGLARGAEHPASFYPNGAVTIFSRQAFAEHGSPYTAHTVAYEIDWPHCLDIDEPEDLELARQLAERGWP